MHRIIAHVFVGGHMTWEVLRPSISGEGEGVIISFPQYGKRGKREAIDGARRSVEQNRISWIQAGLPGTRAWSLDLNQFKQEFTEHLGDLDWLCGTVTVEPELERYDFFGEEKLSLEVAVSKELVLAESPKKVFLSHKGINKSLVRRYKTTLDACGLDVWIDEDAMPAGTNLERGILEGFRNSCAAVFFVTPDFVDEGYLATEIDYAIAEKRKKGDRFSIITLLLTQESQAPPKVPDLLKPYVWHQPETELDGIREILRALPLEGVFQWRTNAATVTTGGPMPRAEEPKSIGAIHDDALRILQALTAKERQVLDELTKSVQLPEQVTLHHLEELADRDLVSSQHARARPTQYLLTKGGRAYLFEKELLS